MENNEHPTWLVPIDIAKELKEIGFNEPCNHYMRISNDDIKLKINHSSIGLVILKRNSEYLNDDIASFVTIPTWTDVFAWFRSKGYHSTLHTYSVMLGNAEEFRFYYEINSEFDYIADTEEYYKTYEEAQKECVKALIKTYKNELEKNNL